MRKIRAVFFDAGNTLLYLDLPYLAAELEAERVAADMKILRRAEYDSRRSVDKMMSEKKIRDEDIWPVYFRGILDRAGLRDEVRADAVMARIKERNVLFGLWNYVPEGIRETLVSLREAGYALGIISNSDGSLAALLEKSGLAPLVDFALDSCILGVEKPGLKIFRAALDRCGEPPAACVHVGDIYAADVLGARGAGIHPVFLDPFGEQDVDCDVIRSIPEITDVLDRLNGTC